jgi:hypothetical protein
LHHFRIDRIRGGGGNFMLEGCDEEDAGFRRRFPQAMMMRITVFSPEDYLVS